jgi:hypothetical protein
MEGSSRGLIDILSQRLLVGLIKLSGFDVNTAECTIVALNVTQRQLNVTMAEYSNN